MSNYDSKIRKTVIVAVIAAVICLAAIVAMNIGPSHNVFSSYNEADLTQSIKDSDYGETVKIYNAIIAGDDEKESEYNPDIEQIIDGVITSWSTGSIDGETAINELSQLKEIDNKSLSTDANNEIRFITVETTGDASYAEAEKQFEKAEYYQALVALSEIDPSYSQYYFVEDFKTDCETILLALISSPTTREEYADCEEKIELYLAVDDADCFKERKAELETQRDDFYNAAPFLEKAEKNYNAGHHKAAFDQLEYGLKKNPDNVFLKRTLDEYHNVYVIQIAQEVNDAVQKEQYKDALELVDEAITVYDCNEFNDLRIYVKECQSSLYKAKNNIKEKVVELKDRLSSGEVDVETAKKEAGEYVTKSGKKFVLGDYTDEEVTLLSVSGEVATSLVGVDMAADVRDLSYDISHWGEGDYFALTLATDTVALIPVIGTVKYLKYSKEAGKGAKKGAKAAKDLLGGTTATAKKVNKIIDNSTSVAKNAEQSVVITKVSLTHLEKIKLFKKATKVKKGLEYTSRDDVVIYARKYKELPPNFINKAEARELKRELGITEPGVNPSQYSPGKQIGGDVFENRDGLLPSGKNYIECDVDYSDATRGAKRLVFTEDFKAAYYTDNHYQTFTQLY